jgi:hypothetical protein
MWSLRVIVLNVLTNQIVKVLFAKDEEVIQAFLLNGLHKPLDVGVEIR